MELNIKTEKNVSLVVKDTTDTIKKALSIAEYAAKVWIENAMYLYGGEIVPKKPIHWCEGNYITKLVDENGEVSAWVDHKTRQNGKTEYRHVATFPIEGSAFKWTELYTSLTGEDVE